jgi:hypothetical protein
MVLTRRQEILDEVEAKEGIDVNGEATFSAYDHQRRVTITAHSMEKLAAAIETSVNGERWREVFQRHRRYYEADGIGVGVGPKQRKITDYTIEASVGDPDAPGAYKLLYFTGIRGDTVRYCFANEAAYQKWWEDMERVKHTIAAINQRGDTSDKSRYDGWMELVQEMRRVHGDAFVPPDIRRACNTVEKNHGRELTRFA